MALSKAEHADIDRLADKIDALLAGHSRQAGLLALMDALMAILADSSPVEFNERFAWLLSSLGRHPIAQQMRNVQ